MTSKWPDSELKRSKVEQKWTKVELKWTFGPFYLCCNFGGFYLLIGISGKPRGKASFLYKQIIEEQSYPPCHQNNPNDMAFL